MVNCLYECKNCGHAFEKSMSSPNISVNRCPHCGSVAGKVASVPYNYHFTIKK